MTATKSVKWEKVRSRLHDRVNELSIEERECVLVALRVLQLRHSTLQNVAKLMGVTKSAVRRATTKGGKPSAGFALRVAKLAGVPVGDVLQGSFPPAGCCPYCGGSTET